jgi:hypothetical protein
MIVQIMPETLNEVIDNAHLTKMNIDQEEFEVNTIVCHEMIMERSYYIT